jgi:hypothetical protein
MSLTPQAERSKAASVLSRLALGLLSACMLIGSAAVTYSLATGVKPTKPRVERTESEGPPTNPFAAAHGRNLVAYTFIASDCGWSTLPRSRETIRSLRTRLRTTHQAEYAQISVVGVGLDLDASTGVAFLADIAGGSISEAFDQVLVGGSWLNDKALQVMWSDRLIKPALPQILVVERSVGTQDYIATSRLTVGDDRIVANIVGEREIADWATGGFRLDPVEATAAAAKADSRK